MSITLDGSLGISTPTYNGTVASEYQVPVTGFKNRIINGSMVIDQRNAGASVTNNATVTQYSLDRWNLFSSLVTKFTAQQSSDAPTGFSNSLLITSSSAYSIGAGDYFSVCQKIEGFNTSDLSFGTANAKTVTLSFWVKSSLTGTFGGSLLNGASNRSYPFTYTISSANTWIQITTTVVGDTAGTWIGATNGIGLRINFGLGVGTTYSGTAGAWAATDYESATGATSVVGTNGATFYITGVQLEKGSTATSFDYRPYGTELALCMRYYSKGKGDARGGLNTNTQVGYQLGFAVEMRTTPTIVITTNTGTPNQASQRADGFLFYGGTGENTGTWTASAEL